MFKELKVIKLLIFVSLLSVIIFKIDFSDLVIQELYTDKVSYQKGDTVKVYSSSNLLFTLSLDVDITNISEEPISSFSIDINNQKPKTGKILQNGLGYKSYTEFVIPSNFESGIYLINNKYPLIVKSKEKATITVVYPFMNNILYYPVNNETVFTNNTPSASLNRTCEIDSYSEGMANFFSFLNTNYKVNYISDIEMENSSNFNLSDLLIVYGKSTCWTPKMITSLEDYIGNGGNVLTITSYLANNICWQKKKNQITLVDSSNVISGWNKYDSTMPESLTGTSYSFSGYSDIKEYYIAKKHKIFKGLETKNIPIDALLFSAPPVIWTNDIPLIDYNLLNYYHTEILAYSKAAYHKEDLGIKGIFLNQRDSTSGKVLSLGAEDWCLTKNIGKTKELKIITKNAIDFLIN